MNTTSLKQSTIEALIGKKIIDAENNWIKLDNGLKVYLEDSEIEMLNDGWDDEALAEQHFFKSNPKLNP